MRTLYFTSSYHREVHARVWRHIERMCAQALRHVMGPTQDIPGPEISAGSRVMSYWFDEYSKYKGFSPACATGARLPCQPPC